MSPARRLAVAATLLAAPLGCSSSDAGSAAAVEGQPAVDAGPTCARAARATEIPATCNGSAALCDRRLDEVTLPMTHNAMSNADDGWAVPNQHHGLARQLADGIRGMMLDTHYFDPDTNRTDQRRDDLPVLDQAYLCHAACAIGRRPLLDGLCDLTQFLDANRGEVLAIIVEDNVTPEDFEAVMRASGLLEYVHTHPLGAPWPTLRELVERDERLVVFSESGDGDLPWYHPAWKHVWDTPYTFASTEDFTCALNRGSKDNALFLVNHWIQNPSSDPRWATEANAQPVLLGRAEECAKEAGRRPTFLGTDFYDIGALFEVVDAMNAE